MKKWIQAAFVAETIITTFLIWLVTYYIIYMRLAGGHRLAAYIFNIVFIAIVLVLDKVANHFMAQEGFFSRKRGKFKGILARLLFFSHFVSFKSALYLFYIVMLIISRVSVLEPELVNRDYLSFIYSVEYGILLLIPLDKFIELIGKDDRRMLKIFNLLSRSSKK